MDFLLSFLIWKEHCNVVQMRVQSLFVYKLWSRLQPSQVKKIEAVLSHAPGVLCFACPCLLAYFREATNLHCAHEASPCFLLEGGPCLHGVPAQNICY